MNLPDGCSQWDVDNAADPIVECEICGHRAPVSDLVQVDDLSGMGYDVLCQTCYDDLLEERAEEDNDPKD